MPATAAQFLKSEKKHCGRLLSWSILLGLLAGLLIVAQAWLLATVINAVVINGQSLDRVMPYLWSMLPVLAGRSVLVYFSQQTAFSAAVMIKNSIRLRIFQKLNQLGPVFFNR